MKAPALTAAQLTAIRQAASTHPHPRLFWDASDRSLILARLSHDGLSRALADKLRAKCDSYLDPAHPQAVNLDAYDSMGLFTRTGEYFLSRIMEELAFAGWLWADARYTGLAKRIVLRRAREAFQTEAGTNPDYTHCRSPLGIGLTGAPLAPTLDLLRPALSPAEWAEVVAHVRDYYLAYVRRPFFDRARAHSPGFNKTCYGMCAAGLLALAVAEDLPDDELSDAVSEAMRAAFGYVREGMDDDGGTFEGAGYGAICVHQALQLGEALRRHGLPELSRYEPLHRHGRWMTALLAPQGGTVNVGDSIGPDNIFSSILLLARWHRDPALQWAYRRGLGRPDHAAGPYGDSYNLWLASLPTQIAWLDPAAPVQSPDQAGWPRAVHAEGYAVVTFRNGWEQDDVLAVLTGCGRRHTAAGHIGAEAGALNLWARGRELLYDPGYGYSSADAHSTVIVTGKPPVQDGGNAQFGGRTTRFAEGPFAALGGVDLSQMLDCKWAQREVALLRGPHPYLIVADDLNHRDSWAEFDWFWQAAPGARLTLPSAGAPAMIQNGNAVLDIASFLPLPGAYSIEYRADWVVETHKPAPWAGKPEPPLELSRLRMHLGGCNGLLLTVLVPRASEVQPFKIRQLECPQPGVALEVEGPGFKDTVIFAPYNRFLQAGVCTGSGRLAVVREAGGRPAAWALAEGYDLAWAGQPLVPLRGRAGEVISHA